jgi:hypothetical protein
MAVYRNRFSTASLCVNQSMSDTIILIFSFSLLALSIIAVAALIPMWVTASTESERDANHIYKIFWEEAGFRGQKILSASGCILPFVMLARPVFDIEGLVLCLVVSVVCGLYHSSVYRGYTVLTNKMVVAGIVALGMLTVVSLLVRSGALSSFFIVYSIMFVGTAWGGYAVYRRARLIRITRL